LEKKRTAQQMQEISLVSFSGVFALRDGVSEKEFLPRLHAFFQHFIDMGFATGYRRRCCRLAMDKSVCWHLRDKPTSPENVR
jgi:hypothetical protein